jgi:hypothetical protein
MQRGCARPTPLHHATMTMEQQHIEDFGEWLDEIGDHVDGKRRATDLVGVVAKPLLPRLLAEEAYEAHAVEAVEQRLRQGRVAAHFHAAARRHAQRATTRTSRATRSVPAATESVIRPGDEQQKPGQGQPPRRR